MDLVRNVNKTIKIAIAVGVMTLAALTVWGSFGLNHAAIVALDKWGNVAPTATLDRINKSLDTINTPKSGTLSMLDDTILQGRLTFDATNKVLLHEQTQLGTIDGYASQISTDIHGVSTSLRGAADAGRDSAQAATGTLTAATRAIQTVTIDAKTASDLLVQLKPLIASYTATGNDLDTSVKTFNGLMSSPNVTIMLANGAQFTTTAVQLEQKLAQCTLHPTIPCVLKSDILFGAQVSGYLLR